MQEATEHSQQLGGASQACPGSRAFPSLQHDLAGAPVAAGLPGAGQWLPGRAASLLDRAPASAALRPATDSGTEAHGCRARAVAPPVLARGRVRRCHRRQRPAAAKASLRRPRRRQLHGAAVVSSSCKACCCRPAVDHACLQRPPLLAGTPLGGASPPQVRGRHLHRGVRTRQCAGGPLAVARHRAAVAPGADAAAVLCQPAGHPQQRHHPGRRLRRPGRILQGWVPPPTVAVALLIRLQAS